MEVFVCYKWSSSDETADIMGVPTAGNASAAATGQDCKN
jgi:hypothetical protein